MSISSVFSIIVISVNMVLICLVIVFTILRFRYRKLSFINPLHSYLVTLAVSIAISLVGLFPQTEYDIQPIIFIMPGLLTLTIGICMALTSTSPEGITVSVIFSIVTIFNVVLGMILILLFALSIDLSVTSSFMTVDAIFLSLAGFSVVAMDIAYVIKGMAVKKLEAVNLASQK